ncbi:MAG: hypothetical protein VKN72_04775 [Nostocales cyanobacterium 94392]|nr:hypothetical protein [Nostocales cyanobacterium 94392]
MKSKLIQQFVNLYRQVWNTNAGLWSDKLEKMTEAELKRNIAGLETLLNKTHQK